MIPERMENSSEASRGSSAGRMSTASTTGPDPSTPELMVPSMGS